MAGSTASAAIVTLGFTVGTWVLAFVAAGRGGWLERVASHTPGGLLRPFEKVKPSIVGGVQIGVQSYTFRKFTIERMIAEMQKVGLSSVELWNGHLDPMKTSEADFKAVKAAHRRLVGDPADEGDADVVAR